MLFKDHIHFRDELTERVKVFTRSGKEVGEGELRIAPGKVPVVEFDYNVDLSHFKKNTYFLCRSPSKTYTLMGCDVVSFNIYPWMIIKGKKESARFKKFSVVIQGVSEWIDNTWDREITDAEIKKKREEEVFQVSVRDREDRAFDISCEHWCSFGKQEANNYLVEQVTLITFEMKSGYFSLDDVVEKIYDVRNIFSLLLGFPLSIEYVLDRNKTNNKSVYVINSSKENISFDSKHHFLARSKDIYDSGSWGVIFKNFYEEKPEIFKNIWSRLAGNLQNSGFWDHEIMSYVSLVDRYVSINTQETEKKLSNSKFRKLRKAIKSLLEEEKNFNESETDKEVICSLTKQVSTLGNSNFSSFRERFEYVFSEMDENIKNIVGLTEDHFKDLKKLRDQVAHGDVPKTKYSRDLTYEVTLKYKLIMLLLYWAYRDFGFSDKMFISFLEPGFNPLIRQADLNRDMIERINNDYPYLEVTKQDYKKLTSRIYACAILVFKDNTKKYSLCFDYSSKIKEWYRSPQKHKSVEQYIASFIDSATYKNIVYIGNVYAKNGEDSCKISTGVCILNCPADLADSTVYSRKLEYNEEKSVWL